MKREFIFVHINKTGGSSIERALGLPFQHKTAVELKAELGEQRWQDGLTFSFVRNPWDRAVSHYLWRVQTNQTGLGKNSVSFAEWVERTFGAKDARYYDKPKMFMPQSRWLSIGPPTDRSNFQVEFVGRFENLEADFNKLCRLADIYPAPQLPHLKMSARRKDMKSIYTPAAIDTIAAWFAEDIENFGYSWPWS